MLIGLRHCLLFCFLWLLSGTVSASYLEDLNACLAWRDHLKSYGKDYNYKLKDTLPAPTKKIHYWSIRHKDVDLVIPIDDYKSVGFSFGEDVRNVDVIIFESDASRIRVQSHRNLPQYTYSLLEAGIQFNIVDVTCINLDLKKPIKQLQGMLYRQILFPDKPIYLSRLDKSQKGWLLITDSERNGTQWSSVYPSEDSVSLQHTISRKGEKSPEQFGGLLSQHRDDLLAGAEPTPNWLLEIEAALNGTMEEIDESLVPVLKVEGFIRSDTSGFPFLSFEKK